MPGLHPPPAPQAKKHVDLVPANTQVFMGVASWSICSVGMMVFNKLAIQALPLECTLVALQMAVSVIAMLVFCWRSIHIGSLRDVLRWCAVIPFYTGMLLTSILALKDAPMSLVVTLRTLSPLLSLAIERLYPNPLQVNTQMLASIFFMFVGASMYVSRMNSESLSGIIWVLLNCIFAMGDRLLQRLFLARDQCPVDISLSAITLLNNLLGLAPLLLAAWWEGEPKQLFVALAGLDWIGAAVVAASCAVGVGISYCGIWAQSLISATSFLVLVNANKFVVVLLEVSFMSSKPLHPLQVAGALWTICAGATYGRARESMADKPSREVTEASALLDGCKMASAHKNSLC